MGKFRRLNPLTIVAVIASVAAAAAAVANADRGALYCLVLAQLCMVIWMGVRSWDSGLQWARPEVVLASAWALTFSLASCIYAVRPGLVNVVDYPVGALALVNLSLVCLLVGIDATRGLFSTSDRRVGRVEVCMTRTSLPVLIGWVGIGILGLGLVFHGAGGPIEYLSNLDDEGRLTQGRIYLVWMALCTRYAAQILLFGTWASGERAPPWVIACFLASLGLTSLLGARLFVAAALVEVAIFYVIVRRPISPRVAIPIAVLLAFLVVAVGGAVKRYSNYQDANAENALSLGEYLTAEAPSELTSAYANNYADGVRLITVALVTVPHFGDYERGKLLLRYAVQPIPRSLRPQVGRDPALGRALYPGRGYAHAIPLQASAYLQWGVPAVVVVFVALGVLVAWIDLQVVTLRRISLTRLVLLTSSIVAVPLAPPRLGRWSVRGRGDGGTWTWCGGLDQQCPRCLAERSRAARHSQ